jgi:hypothetical protein
MTTTPRQSLAEHPAAAAAALGAAAAAAALQVPAGSLVE